MSQVNVKSYVRKAPATTEDELALFRNLRVNRSGEFVGLRTRTTRPRPAQTYFPHLRRDIYLYRLGTLSGSKETDAQKLFEVYDSLDEKDFINPPSSAQKIIEAPERYYSIVRQENNGGERLVVGAITYKRENHTIGGMAVKESARNTGVMETALNALLKSLALDGVQEVNSFVKPRNTKQLARMERWGFRRIAAKGRSPSVLFKRTLRDLMPAPSTPRVSGGRIEAIV